MNQQIRILLPFYFFHSSFLSSFNLKNYVSDLEWAEKIYIFPGKFDWQFIGKNI
jgi:hypothetical protein